MIFCQGFPSFKIKILYSSWSKTGYSLNTNDILALDLGSISNSELTICNLSGSLLAIVTFAVESSSLLTVIFF